jgi:hypothetical protein
MVTTMPESEVKMLCQKIRNSGKCSRLFYGKIIHISRPGPNLPLALGSYLRE